MENVDKNIIDDALRLCSVVIRTKDKGDLRDIAMESMAPRTFDLREVEYAYNQLETPFYLEKIGILKIISNTPKPQQFMFNHTPKGYFLVKIDYDLAEKWTNETLESRFSGKHDVYEDEIWNKDFQFNEKENTLYLSPYGKCVFSKKSLPAGAKINQRALLSKLVVEAGESGIGSGFLVKQLKQYGSKDPDNRRIDAMIVVLNKRFQKEFAGAKVAIINIGSQGVKRIRLSVRPLPKR
ncbi:MAG: hypothetical protein US62_C0003G0005 [Candidatus Woesebacteria bacterium GW2011_GWA1_37_8]|uniref:Uncharacterized protein n=2 Tax=Candidatus Woeseibacteriota TaxID=1752722 RepID=A0A0G0L9V0_9BACT|nr:MAG: hypothetical protein US39_C0010G0004 [Microgenomates group bacterium GW2011_GWC1_37_12b]KKQ46256.1 MAG: hypothetical protein US62_C0003G0005 [Candidatus Woesebacteria bacterium GW2011_GWA1_37_8]KKQ87782.1 MAG: hypothetical protein UT10_C0001G0023 [Candidatus Woesebacteria bacterium GW2011_GWB1_38_8b]